MPPKPKSEANEKAERVPKDHLGDSQCQAVGGPPTRTWDDYESGCCGTFGGGYREESEREIFRHGMSTVFNLLRREFPSAATCKAATELYVALEGCEELLRIICDVICADNPPPSGNARLAAARAALDNAAP